MSYVTWKIEQTPYVNEEWDEPTDTVEVSNPRDITLTVNLGEQKDSFSFNSTNFNGQNNLLYAPNTKINIYRTLNSDTIATSDLIMVGSSKDSPDKVANNNDMTKVEGFNYSEAVSSAIVFADARGLTIDQAIQRALTKAGNNSAFKVEWDASNPTTTTTGAAFPIVTDKWFNWTLKKILEQYSSAKYTGDGSYVWYITKDNTLKWFSKKDATGRFSQYTFDYATDEILEINTKKDIKGVRNHIIIKGGLDPANKGIQESVVDAASVAKHGRKYLFHISQNNNAQDIVKADLGNETVDKYPETYPFTTTWESSITATVNGISMVEGSTVTIPSSATEDKDYNAVVRAHTKGLLKKEGTEIIRLLKYGKFMTDLKFRAGIKNWQLGDLITCTIPQANITNKVLRITQIQYSTTTDMFSLVEDEGTL